MANLEGVRWVKLTLWFYICNMQMMSFWWGRLCWIFVGDEGYFQMVSSPKVNFYKSSVIRVIVDDQYLSQQQIFWIAKLAPFILSILGLRMGTNPRKIDKWQPLIDVQWWRLSSWKNKCLFFFGWRIFLLNSVLNSIPIYLISFFIIPMNVVNVFI